MQEVSRSSLGSIKSVFGSNEDNIYFYNLIKRLNLMDGNFELAKPVIQNNAGFVIWKSENEGPYFRFIDLEDSRLKIQIENQVNSTLIDFESKIKRFNDIENFFDKIIEIPRKESIFYAHKQQGIVVILTEWGFYLDELRQSQGVLKKIFPSGLKSFIINFCTPDGVSVPKVTVELKFNDNIMVKSSDEKGRIKLNNIVPNSTLQIKSLNNDFEDISTVINGHEINVIVDNKVKLSFKVQDKFGRPIINDNFDFRSDELGNIFILSDSEGCFFVEHPLSYGHFQISDNQKRLLLSEKVTLSDSSFIITIDDTSDLSSSELPEIIISSENLTKKKDVFFELLDNKNNPIKNISVDFYGQNGKTKFITDNMGMFKVPDLKDGIEYAIFVEYKKFSWKKDFLHNHNVDKYTFNVKGRRLVWWWLPIIVFLLFFFVVPLPLFHKYKTYDALSKKPLAGVLIQETTNSPLGSFFTGVTDGFGILKREYGKETLFNQFIHNYKTNIATKKQGYYQLTAVVNLGFFRRWRSNLYLTHPDYSKPQYPIEEYNSCNGGEGYNSDGYQVYRFDLGSSNVEFLFEYYNDTALDIISVYCEDGSLLFRENNTTDTDYFSHSEMILSPCRFITVEVDGETNWGIRVHCPM